MLFFYCIQCTYQHFTCTSKPLEYNNIFFTTSAFALPFGLFLLRYCRHVTTNRVTSPFSRPDSHAVNVGLRIEGQTGLESGSMYFPIN